jgi:hypothetical protein
MNTSKNSSSKNNQLNRYWCHTCGFFHTDSEQDYLICNYCNQHRPSLLILSRTVHYNYGFSKHEVLQCRDCQKEEMNLFSLTPSFTPVTWYAETYESVCEMIKDICSKSESNIVNYFDAVKRAYRKQTFKILDQYNPMTIRDYLLDKGVKDVNKIDKNLEPLWKFTYGDSTKPSEIAQMLLAI